MPEVELEFKLEEVQKNSEHWYRKYKELQAKNEQAKEIIKALLSVAKFYSKHRDKGAIMDITPIYDAEDFLKKDDNCPDVLCEDCTKTNCNIRKLGLVPDKKESEQ